MSRLTNALRQTYCMCIGFAVRRWGAQESRDARAGCFLEKVGASLHRVFRDHPSTFS
jgi:hypothetical protein